MRRFTLSTTLAAAGLLAIGCEPTSLMESTTEAPPPQFAPPGACQPWPDCKNGGDDGDDGGGTEGPLTATFPDDLAYGGFGILTTGAGDTDLTGTNTADGITAEGTYSLTYVAQTCADDNGVDQQFDADAHPLVALFDGVELNSTDFDIRFDKEPDSNGFDINDRIRVNLNGLQNPDGDDGFVYSVWFRGRPNDPDSGYDPAVDVQYDDSDPGWTSIRVEDEDIFVRQLRCRNAKCKSTEVVGRDRCKLGANYSLKVSK